MKLNFDIKWLIIIGLCAYIFLLQQCGGGKDVCPEAGVTTKTVTSLVKGTADTVFIEIDKPIYIKVNIPVPVTVTVPSKDGDIQVNKYTTEIKDSLLKGTITSHVDGVLVDQDFNYVPLFPKYITRTDTMIIDRTETSVLRRNYIALGAEIGGSATSVNVSPKISLDTKKGYIYSYRYGLLDKTHNVSIVKKFNIKEIFNKKKLAKVII